MSSTPMPARSPGRPRSPEADEAIIRATLELLGEVGYRALSMELVRSRAGVGKATIYRRYSGKDDLVKAAMRHLHHDLPAPPDSGSLAGDMAALAESSAATAIATGQADIHPQLLAEVSHDAELQAIFYEHLAAPRRAVVRSVLERAVDRGEIRADADLDVVVDLLIGSVVYRGLIQGIDTELLKQRFQVAVAELIRGLRA